MRRDALEEQILRASKEVIVKFIEVGRLSPSGFAETFSAVYQAIDSTVRATPSAVEPAESQPDK